MSFKSELNLKIIDNKYIYPPVIVITTLTLALYFTTGFQTSIIFFLCLSLLYVILTAFHIYRGIIKEISYQDQRNQALLNIHSLIKPNYPLPYLLSWAAFPQLISTILTEVKRIKPENIVEIGSGSSTIITSYLLKEIGKGNIISLDHDTHYGKKTKDELSLHGLKEFAQVLHKPLVEQQIKGNNYTWYDVDSLPIEEKSVQILVVDGPPEQTQSHARYPALPLLNKYLSDDAIVILDDAGRKEESEIVEMWLTEFPEFSHEFIHTEKGISILRKKK